MIIGHILFLAGIIFSIITIVKSINSSDKPETYFFIACICFFCSMFLLAMGFCQETEETEEIETEVRSIITENYEGCTFADDNTFYWHGKVYEYKMNEDETQVTVKRRESKTYDLKK